MRAAAPRAGQANVPPRSAGCSEVVTCLAPILARALPVPPLEAPGPRFHRFLHS